MRSLLKKLSHYPFNRCLLAFLFLFCSCASTNSPQNTIPDLPQNEASPTVSIPSPPTLEADGVVSNNLLKITGRVTRAENQSVVGVIVTTTNVNSGKEIKKIVNNDGSFNTEITVSPGHLIFIQAEDPTTQQKSNRLETVIAYGPNVTFEPSIDSDGDGIPDTQENVEKSRKRGALIIIKYLLLKED